MAQPSWAEKKMKMGRIKRDLIDKKEIFIFLIIPCYQISKMMPILE
jgi:hypothetical protein